MIGIVKRTPGTAGAVSAIALIIAACGSTQTSTRVVGPRGRVMRSSSPATWSTATSGEVSTAKTTASANYRIFSSGCRYIR
jgi:hypothetical protein